ncbi:MULTISPECIES: Nif11-like leader peptide family natural product precursor [unclassified Moorena]|uniref:Nif11-like leader peptide family natural product precursor n=3 Tax=Moorena TaxID=1155738 RepID=UPI0013C9AF96|nr:MULTISPECIES: Nif11-like leader peptide family natural product precursor [unclassified Moorena]NEP36974.1 Nif11-like leader peptide family natural product precursor [Moorena sp. SIO3B2]NEP69941.1 Nif11-like leader peptide family natural product precursor [Moorena sp. SIO3A5]NES44279.1 Nif11-like leader peptide family natural product precursor [Moorena sp. SIO2C4]
MSKEAVEKFYEALENTEALRQQVKVITTEEELVKLGANHGYCFTKKDIAAANASYVPKSDKPLISIDCSESASDKGFPHAYHYEFKFSEIPGFEKIAEEVGKLKIKPDTVDIGLYEKSFWEANLKFADVSPADPEFQQRYLKSLRSYLDQGVASSQPEYAWSQFHLINLDRYVDHSLYDDYFRTKVKLIELLEEFFGAEIRFSGSLWYPPNAYRMWHTNETQPGWRMYCVDFDRCEFNGDGKPFFRYMNPETKELVTLEEKPKVVRFFKIESEPHKLLWHCIVNKTQANRWSFGFNVSDQWMNKLLKPKVKLTAN